MSRAVSDQMCSVLHFAAWPRSASAVGVYAVPTGPTDYCTAIDGTTPIAKDQRGIMRPQGSACDIGAFELVPSATATPTATATATPTRTATPTTSPTHTATATPSRTATATVTTTASPTVTPTATATSTTTVTASATATPTRTATATATSTATATGTATTTTTPTATPTPVAGKLKISPKALKFGTVGVNQSKIQTVTIANRGKITKKNQPLPILIEMESTDGMPMPSPFSITTQCDDVELMPSGKGVPKSETSCKVAVQFKPTDAVSYSGSLTIFDDLEPGQMQTVKMTGKGK